MSSFSTRSSLLGLSDDAVGSITSYLGPEDVYRLWMVGAKTLQHRMSRSVTSFKFRSCTIGSILALWPSFISHLYKLTSLMISFDKYSFPGTFQEVPLASLARLTVLTHLELRLPGCDWLSAHIRPSSEKKHPLLKEIFPNLVHLTLDCVGSNVKGRHVDGLCLSGSDWDAFPSNLESLRLFGMVADDSPLAVLFPHLHTLEIKMEGEPIWTLPPSLTNLRIEGIGSISPQTNCLLQFIGRASDQGPLKHPLPALKTLDHITLDLSSPRPCWDCYDDFPALHTLDLHLGLRHPQNPNTLIPVLESYYQSLPKTLTKLTLNSPHFALNTPLSHLPSSITHLEISGADILFDEDLLKSLPRNLNILQYSSFSDLARASPSHLHLWPRSITATNIPFSFPKKLGLQPATTFPNLRSMEIFLPFGVPSLPSSLTDLTILWDLENRDLSAAAHPSSFAQCLASLTCLKKLSATLVPLPLVISAKYLSTPTKATPISYESDGTPWYWLSDVKRQLSQYRSTPMILRLDLFLPSSLEYLRLDPNLLILKVGDVPSLNLSSLQLLFDGESSATADKSVLFSEPTTPPGVPQSVSQPSYFKKLNEFSIVIQSTRNNPPCSLDVGNRVWPTSLRILRISSNYPSFTGGSLDRLLHVIPPQLVELSCGVSRLDRDHIKSLPESLRSIFIRASQPVPGPPNKIQWNDLPRSIVFFNLSPALIEFEEPPSDQQFFISQLPPSLSSVDSVSAGYQTFQSFLSWLVARRLAGSSTVRHSPTNYWG